MAIVRKAVVPAAGLGTRLLSATKEQPKEMLPVFAEVAHDAICLKPVLQLIFEQLCRSGFTEVCFIIGRGKRAIEDHFTPDDSYISFLNSRGKRREAAALTEFYEMVNRTKILWATQPEAIGFGDAVLRAEPFVGDSEFLVHAGDTYVISEGDQHLSRLLGVHRNLRADTTFFVRRVLDPKQYGLAMGTGIGEGVYRIQEVVEKPDVPQTDLAIMPVYMFKSTIMEALRSAPPGKDGEIQLTDGIQGLIDVGGSVYAIELRDDEVSLDIGSPERYWEALATSYQRIGQRRVSAKHNQ